MDPGFFPEQPKSNWDPRQLEIKYFWPLTEQIPLDLDYAPSEQWIAEWRKRQAQSTINSNSLLISNGVTFTSSQPQLNTFVIKSEPKNVGKWEITRGMFVYRPTKPNIVIRFMAKIFLGFKWHNEF